jgi:hypothetical protein
VIKVLFFGIGFAFVAVAMWKFAIAEWFPQSWRTRRSDASTNWQNEGYMADQDGKSWSEIDGTIARSAPPNRAGGAGIRN